MLLAFCLPVVFGIGFALGIAYTWEVAGNYRKKWNKAMLAYFNKTGEIYREEK